VSADHAGQESLRVRHLKRQLERTDSLDQNQGGDLPNQSATRTLFACVAWVLTIDHAGAGIAAPAELPAPVLAESQRSSIGPTSG
jgi:hypothetical protein